MLRAIIAALNAGSPCRKLVCDERVSTVAAFALTCIVCETLPTCKGDSYRRVRIRLQHDAALNKRLKSLLRHPELMRREGKRRKIERAVVRTVHGSDSIRIRVRDLDLC
jgi:hypothetical protein